MKWAARLYAHDMMDSDVKSLANRVEQFAGCNRIFFDRLGFCIDFVSIFVWGY